MGGDGSRRSRSREPHTGVRFARNVKSLLDSGSLGRANGRVIYSKKNAPVALIEVRSLLTCEGGLTTRWSKCVCTGFLKYVLVRLGGPRNKAEGCVI